MSTAQVSQTVVLDEVYLRHDRNVLRDSFKDNAYNKRVLLSLLRGHSIPYSGGKYMSMLVNMGNSTQGGSFTKAERGTLADVHNETSAIYTPTYMREPRVVYETDVIEAGGNDEISLTLQESKTQDAVERLMDEVLSQICQTSKANAKDLNTLLEFITSGGTGAFGTLNPSSTGLANWANKFTGAVDFSADPRATLRNLHNDTSAGGKFFHDVVLLPQSFHEQWLSEADGAVSLNTDARLSTGQMTSNIAIDNAVFYNRPVIWDSTWTTNQATVGLMLDLRGVQLAVHPKWNFTPGRWLSAEADGIWARVSWLYYVAQLVGDSRRTQGYIGALS